MIFLQVYNKYHPLVLLYIKHLFQLDDFFEYKSGEVANLPLLTDTTYEAFFGGIPGDKDLMSGVTAHKGS